MSEPLFRVGDTVRIKPREGYASDYRFSYSNEMTRFAGSLALIVAIGTAPSAYRYRETDDGYKYALSIDKGSYNWASSMLEPIIVHPDVIPNVINTDTTSESTERINIKLKPVEKIKFNFKN